MNRELRRILSLFALSCFTALLPLSPARSGPMLEKAMREARELAESQRQQIFAGKAPDKESGFLHVFYNNLKPFGFCYAFILQGDWAVNTRSGSGYVTDAGESWVETTIMTRGELEAEKGETIEEKAVQILEKGYEKWLKTIGRPTDFLIYKHWLDGSDHQVLTWSFTEQSIPQPGQLTFSSPVHYLIAVPNDQILNVMVGASSRYHADEIARIFLGSLRITQNPECYFPMIRAIYEVLEK
jgi:hypothetical protein